MKENEQIHNEISSWKKRTVIIGKDIPPFGIVEDYIEYPYVVEVIEMLFAWKNKNYGKLSIHLQKVFPSNLSAGKRAGECRKLFESKLLDTFEVIEIEERACALAKVVVKVSWITNQSKKEAVLTFGCVYKNTTEEVAVPWRNNGKWILMPWDIQELYQ